MALTTLAWLAAPYPGPLAKTVVRLPGRPVITAWCSLGGTRARDSRQSHRAAAMPTLSAAAVPRENVLDSIGYGGRTRQRDGGVGGFGEVPVFAVRCGVDH